MTNGQSPSKLWLQLKFTTTGWQNKWDLRNNKIFTNMQGQPVPPIHPSIQPASPPLYHALRNVCFCTSGMQILMSKCYVVKCTIQYNKEIGRLKISHYWKTKEKPLYIWQYIISAIVYRYVRFNYGTVRRPVRSNHNGIWGSAFCLVKWCLVSRIYVWLVNLANICWPF
jgi:hypothetical protein